jgi:ABC-type uncharacterized transport system permease subunit
MLNFIAVALVSYFTQYHYKVPGDPIMQTFRSAGRAHRAARQIYSRVFRERIPLNLAFMLALSAVCWSICFCGERSGATRFARPEAILSLRSTAASRFANRSFAMAVSGALAGMVGINEVLGYRYRYYDGFSDNYGFTGIAVACSAAIIRSA